MKKRMVAIVLTVVTVMALAIAPAFAFVGVGVYSKCYTLTTSGAEVYWSNSVKSGRKGAIWGSDEFKIIDETTNGYFKVEYPKDGGGTKQGWIKMSDVLITRYYDRDYLGWVNTANPPYVNMTATHRIDTYKRSTGGSYGSISKNDAVRVYSYSRSDNRIQVRYPLDSGGYKIAWINESDANKYLKKK